MRDAIIKTNEIQIFFRVSAELREISRKTKPSARKIGWCLSEVASMATDTSQPRLAERCRKILDEFSYVEPEGVFPEFV